MTDLDKQLPIIKLCSEKLTVEFVTIADIPAIVVKSSIPQSVVHKWAEEGGKIAYVNSPNSNWSTFRRNSDKSYRATDFKVISRILVITNSDKKRTYEESFGQIWKIEQLVQNHPTVVVLMVEAIKEYRKERTYKSISIVYGLMANIADMLLEAMQDVKSIDKIHGSISWFNRTKFFNRLKGIEE